METKWREPFSQRLSATSLQPWRKLGAGGPRGQHPTPPLQAPPVALGCREHRKHSSRGRQVCRPWRAGLRHRGQPWPHPGCFGSCTMSEVWRRGVVCSDSCLLSDWWQVLGRWSSTHTEASHMAQACEELKITVKTIRSVTVSLCL